MICKREKSRWRMIFFLKKETYRIRILRIFGPYLRQRRHFWTCVVRKMTKAVASGTCCLCANIRGDFYTLFDPFVRPLSTPPRWPGSPSGHNIATTTLTTIIKYRPLVCLLRASVMMHYPKCIVRAQIDNSQWREYCIRKVAIDNWNEIISSRYAVPPKTMTNTE